MENSKRKIETETFILPAYWATTLMNDDSSGLDDAEEQEILDWLEDTGKNYPAFYCVGCSSNVSWFSWSSDATRLGGDVMEYTFVIND